ncbi:MAG: 4-(cytidine 5'-diphospho)-2-C-methyl-D-erythritol kinase [Chloroflexi bacterium]|nr:4-(cytidine 5'-diphospho)-2-C-methyl-D-erythritol kinase [Chloroflexota bacterium]
MITLSAYAKVNLTLEVLGKRGDGYHEITTVLQTIDLADVLTFEPADEISFVCKDNNVEKVNLIEKPILQAARLLQTETGSNREALIRMESMGIPRASGLGSSSTDPATVLKGLNELWSLALSLDELSELASKIGSDTPFFIRGGTALAQGRGERITQLPSPPTTWLVLMQPPIEPVPDKTAKMYGTLDQSHFTSGELTQRMVNELPNQKSLQSYLLCNTFECTAFDFFEQLDDYRSNFRAAGAESVHLAGAGPSLFTLVESKAQGESMVIKLREQGLQAYVTRTIQ